MSRFRRLTSGLFAFLVAAAPVLAAGSGTDPVSALDLAIANAEARLQKGDQGGAAIHFREALFEGWLLRAALDRLDKRIPSAREALAKAATFAPEDRRARKSLATAQLQVGEAVAAAEVLTRLAGQDARDGEARRLLAKAQAAGGQLEQAVRTLDEASALAADDPELTFLLATEYLWLKRAEPADRLFARIVQARPIPQTHVLIGRAYRDAGEYGRAASSLKAAIEQDPAVRRAHYYLGMVLLADARTGADRLERAIAEFRQELKVAPDDRLASDQHGSALLEAERPAEAVLAFETAVRGETRFLYLLHLGRCQLALERPREAVESLRRALALAGDQGAGESDLEKIHYQLGLGLRKLGTTEDSATHLGEARRMASASAAEPAASGLPPDASPLSELTRPQRDELSLRLKAALASAYFNLGVLAAQDPNGGEAFVQAAAFFEGTAAVDPEFPRVQSALGVAYFNARRFEPATDALTAALARQPDDAGLTRMLALSWFGREEWAKAAPLLRDDPERERSASLQLAYGVALARTGRAGEAVAPLLAAARLAPEQADVRLELGKAYEQLGRAELARRSFEAFQRLKDKQPGSAQ